MPASATRVLRIVVGLALSVLSAHGGTPEMIPNGGPDTGTAGWLTSGTASVRGGRLCVSAAGEAYLRSAGTVRLEKNDVYTLRFTASATAGLDLRVLTPQGPLDPNLNATVALTTGRYPFSFTFSPANQANEAVLEFRFAGGKPSSTVCLSDISMKRIDRSSHVQDLGPQIKVNQVGYLPDGPKRATVVSPATQPLEWSLVDEAGAVVSTGKTEPVGFDKTSGQTVSALDFGSWTRVGEGYTLRLADGTVSFPFKISPNIYDSLRQDALRFYYQQRSGIAIDGGLVGKEYARHAGHPGDTAVPCQALSDSMIAYGEPWGCNYTLDVSKGWYDAGDFGKYVVNGGIAVAQLLSEYERTLHTQGASPGNLGDGSLRVPERGNGVPDILDEVRWELEFLLGMQVPANSPRQLIGGKMVDVSGMAHHKMHGNQWTPLPTDPSVDGKRRELHRPGTAATLNLAAAAAQAARLFEDKAFSEKLLRAARVAYQAAKANPQIYASGDDWDLGGGAYSDDDVSDEFYWAAAELYITTGEQSFADDVLSSPHHASPIEDFSWASTAALGRLDLATVPNRLADRDRVVRSVLETADRLMQVQQGHAYGQFQTIYPWGSTATQLNNIQIVAAAFDLSGKSEYRTAALAGIDYLLGRNALAQSYVTGYGSKTSRNQHTRLYANALHPAFPHPPPGSISGGPNSAPIDPPAKDVLKGCAPSLCYIDDVNSYSTNEVAINWNSGLAWVSAWAADQGSPRLV